MLCRVHDKSNESSLMSFCGGARCIAASQQNAWTARAESLGPFCQT